MQDNRLCSEAAVMENPLFGYIVGNVKGVKNFRRSDALKQKKAVRATRKALSHAVREFTSAAELLSSADVAAAQSTDPSLAHLCKYVNIGVSRTRNWGRTLFYRKKGRLFREVTLRNGQTSRQFVVSAQYR